MSICSGDIRDQSRKLSEIAPKFGRFWHPHLCHKHIVCAVRLASSAAKTMCYRNTDGFIGQLQTDRSYGWCVANHRNVQLPPPVVWLCPHHLASLRGSSWVGWPPSPGFWVCLTSLVGMYGENGPDVLHRHNWLAWSLMRAGRIDSWSSNFKGGCSVADDKKADGANIRAPRTPRPPFPTGSDAWSHWSSLRSTLRVADRPVCSMSSKRKRRAEGFRCSQRSWEYITTSALPGCSSISPVRHTRGVVTYGRWPCWAVPSCRWWLCLRLAIDHWSSNSKQDNICLLHFDEVCKDRRWANLREVLHYNNNNIIIIIITFFLLWHDYYYFLTLGRCSVHYYYYYYWILLMSRTWSTTKSTMAFIVSYQHSSTNDEREKLTIGKV